MEQWADSASAGDPRLATDSDSRSHAPIAQPQPHPPVLSFRTFHSQHFSSAQRHAFFGASALVQSWFQHPLWPPTFPLEHDTTVHPSSLNDLTTGPAEVDQALEQAEHNDETLDGGFALDQDQPPALQLSKEAIEIFEFSRRFKREKAEAALREQTRIKRRRVKRRKLTKLGLAADEGDSGSEGSSDGTHLRIRDPDGGDGQSPTDEHNTDSEETEEGEEEGQGTAEQEAPAMDTSFLHQRSRQRERTRLQLYGHVAGSAVEGGLARIDVLEAMLNQTYEESLGCRATDDAGVAGKKSKSHGSRASTVYWPGVPLRC
ncbi:hypothetical protein EC968_009505 [Mortierella alpina]|nr:hypothetical protein EC968_009505 [Mortierella alpina]